MRVLYIGGSGEISYACVEESTRLGHEVFVFNRGQTASVEDATVFKGDVYRPDPYQSLVDETFDVVCQFLAYDPSTVAHDIEFFEKRCAHYLFVSTASVYQKPWHNGLITEQTPLENPFWEYSRKKIACEQLLREQDRLPVTIVRPSHTYRTRLPGAVIDGNHQSWRMLKGKPVLVHGDGQSLWTLTHAADFARAFCQLLGNQEAISQAVHITDDQAHAWSILLQSTGRILGVQPELVCVANEQLVEHRPAWQGPLLGDKANSLQFETNLIKKLVPDWQCDVSLDEGLQSASQFVQHRMASGYEPDPKIDALIDTLVSKYA